MTKSKLEILSKSSLCPLLFTKLCINFCSNIFDKIYKLLLLQRYLYVLLRFLISVCIILSCTLCFKFSYVSFTTSYVFPILFTSGIRVIYACTFAWYLIGVGQLRIHWPSVWGGPGKLSCGPVFNLHCGSRLVSFPSDAQNMATASKFKKLLLLKMDSRSSDIVNSNEFRTKDLVKSPSPDNFYKWYIPKVNIKTI